MSGNYLTTHGCCAASLQDDQCRHGDKYIVNGCLRCGAPVCCGRCCTEDGLHGAIAYQLTKRLVIDMPTARAAVDAAIGDARHAAAELALEADKKLAEQTLTLAHMAGHVADLTAMVDQQTAEIAELRTALTDMVNTFSRYSSLNEIGQSRMEDEADASIESARAALETKP